MSYAIALARANEVRTSLLDHGLSGPGMGGVSIELQTGRNGGWYSTTFECVFSHHTVSRPSNGLTPVLALCKSGRVDVPGPLCNGYGGYDRVYRILCMEWANHAGAGGPTRYGDVIIPRDNARPLAWGTEYEGGLEPWTDLMHEFMSRANAGLIDVPWIGGGNPERHGEHSTWTARKIDRLNISTEGGRAALRPYLGGGAQPPAPPPPSREDTDDMATEMRVLPDGEPMALAVEGCDRLALAATADVTAEITAWDAQNRPYKPTAWAPYYGADNRLGVSTGSGLVAGSPLAPGTRRVTVAHLTGGELHVRAYKLPAPPA